MTIFALPRREADSGLEDVSLPDARQSLERERPSFERIYDDEVEFVWRMVRRLGITEEAAPDVVQQIFLVVLRKLPTFRLDCPVRSWVFSIIRRVVADHRRLARRKGALWSQGEALDLDAIAGPASQSPHDSLEIAEAARTVETILESLDSYKRTVFILAELEQLSANEIADMMNTTREWVYSRLRAARIEFERAAQKVQAEDRGTDERT